MYRLLRIAYHSIILNPFHRLEWHNLEPKSVIRPFNV